jgi:hypothetical protein
MPDLDMALETPRFLGLGVKEASVTEASAGGEDQWAPRETNQFRPISFRSPRHRRHRDPSHETGKLEKK